MCSLKLVWITSYFCINGPTCLLSPSLKVTQYLPYKSMLVLVTQLCPTLCDPMDSRPPGSSVCGILQARILGVAISFSRRSSQHRNRTRVSCIADRRFIVCSTREATFENITSKESDKQMHQERISWPLVFVEPQEGTGKNDAKDETPVLWPPHAKSWFIGKVSDAGRDWGQDEKGTTEDEMTGWHHWLDGRV